jgi:DNA-binding beta-propeller fold protein YncE
MPRFALSILLLGLSALPAFAQSFVNWENAHVHPLDITADGTKLLAVNTADNRLFVFDLTAAIPSLIGDVPVGLEPVSVRSRTNDEVWVVNHISDSISIVRLSMMNVVATLKTADEPCDVVFAGNPVRAFVSCSQVNTVQVFDPANLAALPTNVVIDGEDPRAMAVSPDGGKVYVAVFESGNRSTILAGGSAGGGLTGFFPPNAVSHPAGPYGGLNPPPNAGVDFDPPMNPANASPPTVGLIVRKNVAGLWMDDNDGDWTALVSGADSALSGRPAGWDLVDHDLAIIDAATLTVTYVRGLMNLCMGLAVNPATGTIAVVGTDALNEIRFEPNLNGRFLRVNMALVDPAQPNTPQIVDLNSHLTYSQPTLPLAQRELSIGDPRSIAWNAAGDRAYVTGMGSNNLVILDANGNRIGMQPTLETGEGPTGIVVDESRERIYVLNRFEASISVIAIPSEEEVQRISLFDPTPAAVRLGRQHFYDTHLTSGLGHVACASCHPDGRMDRLAWDLGNPAGEVKTFNQNCNFGSYGNPPQSLGPPPCPDWHPMKGPMVTQTLQDIIGKEPHHWRGDRDGIEEFNQTFTNLQGKPELLSPTEMQAFEDFLASLAFPPNPYRNFNNSLPANLPLPGHFFTGVGGAPGQPLPNGNASLGLGHFNNHHIMPGFGVSCSFCHKVPVGVAQNNFFTGQTPAPFPVGPNGELHHAVVFSQLSETRNMSIKVPQLRNLHEKTGFDLLHTTSRAGFGFMHDGSVDTLVRFFSEPFFGFNLAIDGGPTQRISSMTAFMLAFSGSDYTMGLGIGNPGGGAGPLSNDTHAAVGTQLTIDGSNNANAAVIALINDMIAIANAQPDSTPGPLASVVVKGIRMGEHRGYAYVGSGQFQSDRSGELVTADALRTSAAAGAEITFTVVPRGTQMRIGIDRDEDGFFDRDELDACSDPANAASVPGDPSVDIDADGDEDFTDVDAFVAVLLGAPQDVNHAPRCDLNCDGAENGVDVQPFIAAFLSPGV